MPQAKTKQPIPAWWDAEWEAWDKSLPVVHYPPEVMARWDKEIEITEAQIATGEIKPQTVDELAEELGIKRG
ncbi:MAG: hypothetical protein LBH93_08125 [Chitinispirillales bacterium]|jgi:hypothetical protein|nr:hypothetical protein [Chitinispirillales bacterium]